MAHATPDARHADDVALIHEAALDYMQSWYDGDAERMARCLHPELVKRAVLRDQDTGAERFHHLDQRQMVAKTRQGGGSADVPADQRYYTVTVLDIYGDIASARADSYEYVDYLQLARSADRWLIVNILWAPRSPAGNPPHSDHTF